MNEMVERVAKAAYESLLVYPEFSCWPDTGFSVEADEFRGAARAAIAAMREPTHAMAIAALRSVPPEAFLKNQLNYNLLIWAATIDEALRDEQ